MDHINLLIVSGCLERVRMRYKDDGTPICSGRLRVDEPNAQGTIFRTFISFEAFGKAAEALSVHEVGNVLLLQGKCFWRKHSTAKGEEKSGLALLVAKSSVLLAMASATATGKE